MSVVGMSLLIMMSVWFFGIICIFFNLTTTPDILVCMVAQTLTRVVLQADPSMLCSVCVSII